MIVTCSQCHAKFRVADEKVGPRGAKVRCSRCHTVFLVGVPAPAPLARSAAPPPPPQPRIDLDLETGARPVAAADPFSATAPGPPPAAPGFGPAVQGLGDPFVATVQPRPGPVEAGTALVTDLSDLAQPAPPPAAWQPEAFPAWTADPGGRESPLALEDRTPAPPPAGPPPLPHRPPPIPVPGAAGFTGDDPLGLGPDEEWERPGDDLPGVRDEPLEPAAALAPVPVETPAAPPPAEPARARPAAAARRAPEPEPDSEAEGRRREAATADRIRAVAVNAIALVALLVLSLGLLLMWRGRAPLEAGALRPAALLEALAGRDDGPFPIDGVSNGLYERARGEPLLFVRGRVVSRAGAAVRGVRVSVELLRGAAVLARGEALAGAVPTPEELWSAAGGDDLARIAQEAAARAPAAVRPGDEIPFLVAIPDYPADLSGATLRVVAAPLKAASSGAR